MGRGAFVQFTSFYKGLSFSSVPQEARLVKREGGRIAYNMFSKVINYDFGQIGFEIDMI
jgi:hypothetical protein